MPPGITGRTYLERGKPVVIVTQWKGKGPRNVAIRREDGSVVLLPLPEVLDRRLDDVLDRRSRGVERVSVHERRHHRPLPHSTPPV